MADDTPSEKEVAELVQRVREGASAFIRGDMRRYVALIPHSADYTLIQPLGGEPRRVPPFSDEDLDAMADYFGGPGEAELEVFATHASGDLVVLVAVERQHGVVGGLPAQDWSLRITLVFRREEGEWRLVHRHADGLVHEIDLEQLVALARGGRS